MARPLPYPGHTWSFVQHAVGLEAKTLYDFLKCAAAFEGETKDYSGKITTLMVATGILTQNQRNGKADAWRDYQQILAELGLIYSTRLCPVLTLTELGHMFLAGDIGFAELVGMQALRHQYPNGQKSDIQNRLNTELELAGISRPDTLMELQSSRQVLVKPGALMLRVLSALLEYKQKPYLSVSECQAFLIPCRTNSEWQRAVAEIIAYRKAPSSIDRINRHSRRNIQDWFKFLKKSDYFVDATGGDLALSEYAITNLESVKNYCAYQEDASSFWIPTRFDKAQRVNWFKWFGHAPLEAQKILRRNLSDIDYIQRNYVVGFEDNEQTEEFLRPSVADIKLRPVDIEQLSRNPLFDLSADIDSLTNNMLKGMQKRHAKTVIHDRIVKELAEAFIAQGAIVESDPNSVDLLAIWPEGNSAIFEVKTVTIRSFQERLRMAIGQIEEYAYRRSCGDSNLSDKVIVINTELDDKAWQKDFVVDHLGIGLICKSATAYKAFAPEAARTRGHWLTLGA